MTAKYTYQQILAEIQEERNYLDQEHVYEVYAKDNDMTFIMKEREGESPLLINYYFGEPDTQDTFFYYNKYNEPQEPTEGPAFGEELETNQDMYGRYYEPDYNIDDAF